MLTVCINDIYLWLIIKKNADLGAPVFIQTPIIPETINKDDTIKFECIVEAMPKPTINW